ncbi:MAG: response regulator [Ktedonobacterales bacterium]
MRNAPLPSNEAERLAALRTLRLLDTPPEERFDRVTRTAQRVFDVPIATVTLVDANRQWFKSCFGLPLAETTRDIAFCAHTILDGDTLIIPDATRDIRFEDNPLVTGEPYLRFYAGQPLRSLTGHAVGTLCIMDSRPRQLSDADVHALKDLAAWAENELNSVHLSQALEVRRESEIRIRTVMDSVADGIVTFDERGIIESLNPAAERIFGVRALRMVGQHVRALLPDAAIAVPAPAEVSDDQRARRRFTVIGEHREAEGQRKDGTTFPADLAISAIHRGKHTRFIAIVRDITARKRSEEHLHDTLAKLEQQYLTAERARGESRAVLDAVSEAIVLVGPDRRLLDVNQRFTALLGVPAEAALGRHFNELSDQVARIFADPAAFIGRVTGTVDDTQGQFTEVVAQQWPEQRELELYTSPVHTASGDHLGRLYMFRDVTHEREVDRMKSEFVSLVSHELRTPLTSIKGYVDLLLDGDAGDVNEEQQEYLEIVRNNSDRLVALINDLLDVSRIESGKIELQRAAVDLAHLIESTVSSLRPQIDAKGQHLSLDLAPALPTIMGDANRVTQILTNLLSNAYKYTPREGNITVSAHGEQGCVRVAVRDTGIGLSPEEQAQLFTKFYRAQNRTTQEVGGTGLGLTITRSLVEMHGGAITVTSAPGMGSTFSFTLPTAPGATEHAPPTPAPAAGRCILVVDDEPDIANLIARYLERAGYRVVIGYTATQGFQLAQTEQPDLITLDIILPDADGFTMLEWLKNSPATAHIPVVMLSMLDDAGHGRLLGAVDYLSKPVQEHVLVERVGSILASDQVRCVLVADDEDDIRRLIAENLRRAGYQVIEAADGDEVVALAEEHHPGLALLDIKMPRMDGIMALRALRASEATRDLPVIMMTASPGALEAHQPLIEAMGGATLLHKPWTIEELATAIAQGLAGAGSSTRPLAQPHTLAPPAPLQDAQAPGDNTSQVGVPGGTA